MMRRISYTLGVLGALYLIVIGSALATGDLLRDTHVATSTIAVAPVATTTPEAATPPAGGVPEQVSAKATTTLARAVPVVPTLRLSNVAAPLEHALVNILCIGPIAKGGRPRILTGSGVVIDPKGIILTNAHVAISFLLESRGMKCSIRTGSPATAEYTAAPIFISPAWVSANAKILSETDPAGTGEHDFALLAITGTVSGASRPPSFSSLPLGLAPPKIGTPVVIASYPAQSLSQEQLKASLFPTLVFASVDEVYTFGRTTIDVLEISGSATAQGGSSGGGVADVNGRLVGIITTSEIEGDYAARRVNVLTASYLRADYATETGEPIDFLLARPITDSVAAFAPQISKLAAIITKNL